MKAFAAAATCSRGWSLRICTSRDPITTDWIKTLNADQPRTALVGSVFELLDRTEDEQPAAIVIVTDGRDNASSRSFADLATKARDRKIPLLIYGVGSSSFGQLRLRDASVPESVFLDDIVVVPVRYAVKGIAEGCVLAGCALVGGETAEHPGLLGEDDFDVAGAGTGVVEADRLLGPDRIRTGDAVNTSIAVRGSWGDGVPRQSRHRGDLHGAHPEPTMLAFCVTSHTTGAAP